MRCGADHRQCSAVAGWRARRYRFRVCPSSVPAGARPWRQGALAWRRAAESATIIIRDCGGGQVIAVCASSRIPGKSNYRHHLTAAAIGRVGIYLYSLHNRTAETLYRLAAAVLGGSPKKPAKIVHFGKITHRKNSYRFIQIA